jgi:hypothetical protein
MKHPSEMLLRLLLAGESITFKDYTYVMSDDGDLCVLYQKGEDEIAMGLDFKLGHFIKLAELIGKDELWLAGCSLALKERNKKRGPEEKSPEPPYAVDNLMD